MITLGIETLTDGKTLTGRRIGLLAHPASVDRHFRHALSLVQGCGAEVSALFGPEHGFSGEAQDMEPVASRVRHPSGIPLVSLYGKTEESLGPTPTDLAGLDALVVDLMDVGARYYTFVWTALLALRACHRAGVELILADRPNPLGGASVEGAPQTAEYLSFVGLKPVANRHGMTPGELLSMAASDEGIADALTVVPMSGWRREMGFDETGQPFVYPSPNMPTLDTAWVYPGMCLLESTGFSEGRGTTRPFELFGGPGIDGEQLAETLETYTLPGVRFRPVSFKPEFQKHKGCIVGGVQLHVTDRLRFRPYRTGVAVLFALKTVAPNSFSWRTAPYEFVVDKPAIDLLSGSPVLRELIDQGGTLADAAETWKLGEAAFRENRKPFLLY